MTTYFLQPVYYVAKLYNKCIFKWPLTTSISTVGPITGLGDIIAQLYIEQYGVKEKTFNFTRFKQMTFIGFTFHAIHKYYFYMYINPWYSNILCK